MNDLNSDLNLEILKFFNYDELKNLSYVNKELNKLILHTLNEEFIVVFQTCHGNYMMKPSEILYKFSDIKSEIQKHINEVKQNYDMFNKQVGYDMLTIISVSSCCFNFLQFDISNIVTYIKFSIKFCRRDGYTEYSTYNLFVTVAPKHSKKEIEDAIKKLW